MACQRCPDGQYFVVLHNRSRDFQDGPNRPPLDLASSKVSELRNMLNLDSCLQSSAQSSYQCVPLHYRHCCCQRSQVVVECGNPDSTVAEMEASCEECLGQTQLDEEILSFQVTDEDEPSLDMHIGLGYRKVHDWHEYSRSLHDPHHGLDCGRDHESPTKELSLMAHLVAPFPTCMAQGGHIASLDGDDNRPASWAWCYTRSCRSLVELGSLACFVEHCWEEY